MKIGERLAAEMESRGISEGELGRRSGVNQPTIHRIITGESKNPRQDNVEKIAKALGRTSNWLWTGEKDTLEPTTTDATPQLSEVIGMYEELELTLYGEKFNRDLNIPDTKHLRSVTDKIKEDFTESNKRFRETQEQFIKSISSHVADLRFLERIRKPRVLSIMMQISQAAAEDRLTDEDLNLLQAVVDRLSTSKKQTE